MTGDTTIDSVMLIVALILGAVGNAFGWPVLVKIADWIKARDEASKPKLPEPGPGPEPMPDTKEIPSPTPPKEIL